MGKLRTNEDIFITTSARSGVLSVLSCYFQGKHETLLPWRKMAKLSGTLMEVSQDLIYVTELYIRDENVRER